MAPNSQLRFNFLVNQPSTEPLRIRIDDEGKTTPVPIGEDGSFSVNADGVFGKSAALVANRPKSAGKFAPLVRSPDFGGSLLRLGDLRLECAVLWEMEKDQASILTRVTFESAGGPCNSAKIHVWFQSERRISSAAIRAGDRVSEISVVNRGLSYRPPIFDKSFGNDALVYLTFTEN
ncbi:MAG: hypothetical protein ACKPBV_27855 [Sphaerospermopsis kisseleviana]